VRLRSVSILATSTFFALLGCPLDEMSASSNVDPSAFSDGSITDNTESHDDRVDAASDVTWAQSEVGAGRSALRVLMTDAPVDADNVFVTICGIHVHSLGPVLPGTPDATDPRDTAGVGGGTSAPRDEGSAGAGAGGAGSAGTAGAGGAGAGGDGQVPEATEPKEDPAQAAAAGGAEGGLPSDDAESDAAEADAAEAPDAPDADEAGSAEENIEGDDRGYVPPVDERDPAQAPPPNVDGLGPREGEVSGEWLAVSEQCQTLDLLTLQNGVTEAVGVAALPPGRYGQIRLLIADASVVVQGEEHSLQIPSGSESGLKIIGGFELFDGEATTITLDFDAGRSVQFEPGTGYMMTPVIELIDVSDHAVAPGAEGDRGGAVPGVAGAGGRDGAGTAGAGGAGTGGAEMRPEDGPTPDMPAIDPTKPEPPKPGEEPPPPPPDGAGGYAGAGGASGDGDGAVPSDDEEADEAAE
jgi:hypothetical protein